MSFPGIAEAVAHHGYQVETATEDQLAESFWCYLTSNFGRAIAYFEDLAAEVKRTGRQVMRIENPNTDEARERARLLIADPIRKLISDKLDIDLTFYNCHGIVADDKGKGKPPTLRMQMEMQNGTIDYSHC